MGMLFMGLITGILLYLIGVIFRDHDRHLSDREWYEKRTGHRWPE